jgi:F420-non-reducing hydrogenase iron-sulfur subunit
MKNIFEPKILAFLCNWCAYAGADLAGVSRIQYPPTIRVIRTMCSGRVDPLYIIRALKSGFDSVFVSGWHIGECHYLYGNIHVSKELKVVEYLLDLSGIGKERLCLRWVSASEGRLFADYVEKFSQQTRNLGPFDPKQFRMELAAMDTVLKGSRLRWLMGAEIQLTEKGNVYKEKLCEDDYRELLQKSAEEEYQMALILEALRDGAKPVRDIAFLTGLPVYTVSQRLGGLERRHQAELSAYDGTTPRFVSLAA